MRTSEKLDEHCVGNGEAFMWHDENKLKWSLKETAVCETRYDCRVYAYQDHVAWFHASAPPHFYDLLAASVERATGEIDDEGVSMTKPGYVGQMKGIKQYLWERGALFLLQT